MYAEYCRHLEVTFFDRSSCLASIVVATDNHNDVTMTSCREHNVTLSHLRSLHSSTRGLLRDKGSSVKCSNGTDTAFYRTYFL